jgi:hypothetical protein
LPRRHRPVVMLPIGKPAGPPATRTSRRPLERVATFVG